MSTKTVQIYGKGFGPSDATITVTLDGQTIFDGSIPTLNQPVPAEEVDLGIVEPIVSFDLPIDFQGQIPMTCQVTNGTVAFAQILVNQYLKRNPIYTPTDCVILNNPSSTRQQHIDVISQYAVPAFSQDELNTLINPATPRADLNAILTTHGVLEFITADTNEYVSVNYGGGDPRTNVLINGVAQNPDSLRYQTSTLLWKIPAGSTLSYNLNVKSDIVVRN